MLAVIWIAWIVIAILITVLTAKSGRTGGNKALIIVFVWLISLVGLILYFCLPDPDKHNGK